jgi:hypothetical protein
MKQPNLCPEKPCRPPNVDSKVETGSETYMRSIRKRPYAIRDAIRLLVAAVTAAFVILVMLQSIWVN